ncbi:MAG: NFACT family protein, partial [Clostridia bacterium]|nr:NFACT family protein [Clostridia bacterium]
DQNGKIFDAVNRSDITARRVIMPGADYEYPESRGKLDLTAVTPDEIIEKAAQKSGEAAALLLDVCDGVSPLVCREICLSAFGRTDAAVGDTDLEKLTVPLQNLYKSIFETCEYTALYENGTPKDFSFMNI